MLIAHWNATKLVLVAVLSLVATGCADNRWRAQEAQSYYTSQQQLAATRKPLFELKAQPGQTITLQGVESLTVNDPREQKVAPLPEHRSQFLDTVLGVAKIGAEVYGLKLATDGVVNLADTVGKNGGDHSVTNITGSYNAQGDTLNGSIKGDVSGNGAGVGNRYRDGSTHGDGNASGTGSTATNGDGNAVGDGNYVPNGDNNRQNSDGPSTGGNGGNCAGGAGSDSGSAGDTGSTGAGGSGASGGNCGGGPGG